LHHRRRRRREKESCSVLLQQDNSAPEPDPNSHHPRTHSLPPAFSLVVRQISIGGFLKQSRQSSVGNRLLALSSKTFVAGRSRWSSSSSTIVIFITVHCHHGSTG
jgi:hypothetical protein